MLIIRKEQMEALDAEMLESFFRRMVAHLRQLFPAETTDWDDARAREFAKAGVAKAKGFGFVAERDAARFVDLLLALGPDFPAADRFAPVRAILEARQRGASARMDAVFVELAADPSVRAVGSAWS